MRRSFIHLITILILFLCLMLLNVVGGLAPVFDGGRVATGILISPITFSLGKVGDFTSTLFSLRKLAEENKFLQGQVQELAGELARLDRLQQENKELKEALDFFQESRLDLIPARVVAIDLLRPDSKVVIDRGRSRGIAEGDAVVVTGGVLVGVVAEVEAHTARVQLINSSAIAINAQTSSGNATGIVRGEHGLGLLFDLIAQNQQLQVGEKVTTSGLGGRFPRGLLIGEVAEISSSESELFQKASIVPATNLRRLDFIFIVKSQ